MRILLIEDDNSLAASLQETLENHAHSVDWLSDGIDAQNVLERENYDAAILDLGLPRRSGLEILKQARANANAVPIIILTAEGKVDSRVQALNAGADDYLVKPFSTRELLARLGAIARRAKLQAKATIEIGDLRFDSAARRLFIGDKEVQIPKRELALLECLLLRQGKVVPKEVILDRLYSLNDSSPGPNVIDLYIHRLRKRLASASGLRISTLRGLGYLLDTDD